MYKLIYGEALEEMQKMIDNKETLDAIIIDPPYGTTKGLQLQGSSHNHNWDSALNIEEFLDKGFKITDTIIVFGQQPTISEWVIKGQKYYKEELIWVKNKSAQGFHADKMHLKFFENIIVFKNGNGIFNPNKNPKPIDEKTMPIRAYAQRIMKELNIPRAHIHKQMGHRKLEFFLFFRGTLFTLPKREVYDDFTNKFNLKNFDWYKTYDELLSMDDKSLKVKLNGNFSDTLRNVLPFDKDNGSYHPTQKPIKLMEYLIKTYTNEGDTIGDFTMGSGSTIIGAINTNRNSIGVELDKQYFNIAKERIEQKENNE